jgi:tetratricopeptide (TPR) repeat protein
LAQAHALLGDAAVELGKYDEAFDHYQRQLDLRPDLSSYSRSAHLLWLTGNVRRAQWLMRKAIAAGGPQAENTAWCRAQLALMMFHNGALIPAEREAQLALEAAPDNLHVLAAFARIKTAKKDYDAAMKLYRRSIELLPTHESLAALGDLYALTGRTNQAEKQFQRLIELDSTGVTHTHDGNTHTHAHGKGNAPLAHFFADHDRELARALEEARLACEQFPNVFVLDTLAWCYYKNGLYKEAKETITKALKWKTPSADLHFHAGMIYAKLGNRSQAQMHLYQALNLNPHFHPLFAQIAADTFAALPGAEVSESASKKNAPAESGNR